jgi:hypothetical protein
MNRRRGISLIEALTVMSGFTVILTLTGSLLHRSMQSQSQTRYFFEAERTALRLSQQFRDDVHAAAAATIEDATGAEGIFLRLRLADNQTVEYQRDEARIIRVLPRADGGVSREEYPLSPGMELELREEDAPRRLVLTVVADATLNPADPSRRPASVRELPVSLSVEAVLSRDLRFASSTATEEAGE